MARIVKTCAAVSALAALAFFVWYALAPWGLLLTFAITFATAAYHFAMRLLVGAFFNSTAGGEADYRRRCYRVGAREMALYRKLGVRRWKKRVPTYDSALFDPRRRSWDDIARETCRSERVHATSAALSFAPVLASAFVGALPVFIATSVLAAAFDVALVAVQRYNRARIVALLDKKGGVPSRKPPESP